VKRNIILIFCLLATIIFIGSVTVFAIWQEQLQTEENIINRSGDWNESEKYFIFNPVYEESVITSYSVIDYQGIIDKVEIPRSYLGKPVISIKGEFVNNSIIKEIIIPDTVIIIEAYAFLNFTRLDKVIIQGEEKTLTIGDYSFMNCTSLVSFIIDTNRLLSISASSFYNTDSIIKPVVS
jgi:hypothetical protein